MYGESNSTIKQLKSEAAGLDVCVEPVDVMRRNHMELLFHKRDQTMHQGIRTERHQLTECISCHVDKDDNDLFIPINAQGQFCQSCHQAVAAKLDCFDCHRTTPDSHD